MFSKRLDGRTAEDQRARRQRECLACMPNCAPVAVSLGGEIRVRSLPLTPPQTWRRAERVWGERSPGAAARGSEDGYRHLSRSPRGFTNGASAREESDCHGRASLVSIPETHGTRLGPIGVSPNIVVTIAALGDPCLQS
jgi:hypothetical protein